MSDAKISLSLAQLESLLGDQKKICAEWAAMQLTNSELRQIIKEDKSGAGDMIRQEAQKCRFPDDFLILKKYLS